MEALKQICKSNQLSTVIAVLIRQERKINARDQARASMKNVSPQRRETGSVWGCAPVSFYKAGKVFIFEAMDGAG